MSGCASKKARAEREELKAKQLAGELCRASDFDDFVRVVAGAYLEHFGSLPIQIADRDLELRKRVEDKVRVAQGHLSDALRKLADEYEGGGKGRSKGKGKAA
jgi:hypothetical protein